MLPPLIRDHWNHIWELTAQRGTILDHVDQTTRRGMNMISEGHTAPRDTTLYHDFCNGFQVELIVM